MEWLIFNTQEYQTLYNCTNFDIGTVPLAQRQNIPLGLTYLTVGTFEFLLYIPCMAAIWRHMENPCYKIMFYIGILDMSCLCMNAIATGILGIIGAVYCSSPVLIYTLGAVGGIGLWMTETTIEIFLALNRCIEICSPRWGEILFKGWRTWLWMIPPTLYGIYATMFTYTLCFSGIYVAWFFNPYQGYINDDDNSYNNVLHQYHNWFVLVGLTVTYFTFGFILLKKTWQFSNTTSGMSTAGGPNYSQKMIFLQVVLISSVNASAAMIYVYMNLMPVPMWLIAVGQLTWIQAHGIPPVIYLLMNRTLRTDCLEILGNLPGKLLFWRKQKASSNNITALSKVGNRLIRSNANGVGSTTTNAVIVSRSINNIAERGVNSNNGSVVMTVSGSRNVVVGGRGNLTPSPLAAGRFVSERCSPGNPLNNSVHQFHT